MKNTFPSHYAPLHPPACVNKKITLLGLLETLLDLEMPDMDVEDIPNGLFYVYPHEESTEWGVGEIVDSMAVIRFKNNIMGLSYSGSVMIIIIDDQRHVLCGTDYIHDDCSVVFELLTGSLKSEDLSEFCTPIEDLATLME